MKKLLYILPLITSLCFGAEPQFYLRELETPKDSQAINENFRNVAGENKVQSTNIASNTTNISDLQDITSNLRGYFNGFLLENDSGDTDHDILINVGMARSADNDTTINLESSLIKQIDATWSAGTNQGGRASGVSLSADTWYHLFVIYNPTTEATDVVFDTSIINANAPSGYTEFRRIGSVLTDGSSNIYQFKQDGDLFIWANIKLDSTSVTGTLSLVTVSTPKDVSTRGIFHILLDSSGTDLYVANGLNGSSNNEFVAALAVTVKSGKQYFELLTNTNSQIYHRYGGVSPSSYSLYNIGWRDFLGFDGGGGGTFGITSLNGLINNTQTFAVGTAGTDFAISSSGSTHTFNLPTASGTNRGALSSTDWTTFNNKLSNIVEDLTPQLGGDLDTNSNDIKFLDNDKAIFGTGLDFEIYSDGNDAILRQLTQDKDIFIRVNDGGVDKQLMQFDGSNASIKIGTGVGSAFGKLNIAPEAGFIPQIFTAQTIYIDQTDTSALLVRALEIDVDSQAGTPTVIDGVNVLATYSANNSGSNIRTFETIARNTGTGTLASARGVQTQIQQGGGGTITDAALFRGRGANDNGTIINYAGVLISLEGASATGTVNNFKFFEANASNYGGTVLNSYGLFLDTSIDFGTTSSYAIYSNSNSDSYIKTNLGLNTATPNALLDVNGISRFGDSTTNYSLFSATGDQSFTGSAGFYPRRINQSTEPASGTGSTQIDIGEMIFWRDTDDGKVYMMYNDTTSGIKKVELL